MFQPYSPIRFLLPRRFANQSIRNLSAFTAIRSTRIFLTQQITIAIEKSMYFKQKHIKSCQYTPKIIFLGISDRAHVAWKFTMLALICIISKINTRKTNANSIIQRRKKLRRSLQENIIINNIANRCGVDLWLGLQCNGSASCSWSDSTQFDYSNFANGIFYLTKM
jgi:hypothetical protein